MTNVILFNHQGLTINKIRLNSSLPPNLQAIRLTLRHVKIYKHLKSNSKKLLVDCLRWYSINKKKNNANSVE
jgi:hypothetical protein